MRIFLFEIVKVYLCRLSLIPISHPYTPLTLQDMILKYPFIKFYKQEYSKVLFNKLIYTSEHQIFNKLCVITVSAFLFDIMSSILLNFPSLHTYPKKEYIKISSAIQFKMYINYYYWIVSLQTLLTFFSVFKSSKYFSKYLFPDLLFGIIPRCL